MSLTSLTLPLLAIGVPVAFVLLSLLLLRQRHISALNQRESALFRRRLDAVTAELEEERTLKETARQRANRAAESSVRGVTDRLMAFVVRQQARIDEMEDRHDDPDVLADLLKLDHGLAELGRHLVSLRVLTGGTPGRQRPASSLTDVLRGAYSTVSDYQRIKLMDRPRVAVRTEAVEPLVHLFGHLMENAVALSPPTTVVEVGTLQVSNGITVSIEDGGSGISDWNLRRAEEMLASGGDQSVVSLGDPPRFGFALVARLAERHGIRVVIDRRSRYAGTRVQVTVPSALLAGLSEVEPPFAAAVSAPPPAPPAASVTHAPSAPHAPPVPTAVPAARSAALPVRERPVHQEPAAPVPPPSEPQSMRAESMRAESPRPGSVSPGPLPGQQGAPGRDAPAEPVRTRNGLPVRVRGAAASAPSSGPPAAPGRPDPVRAGARIGAWQRAARPTQGDREPQ